jgi:cytochrome P450
MKTPAETASSTPNLDTLPLDPNIMIDPFPAYAFLRQAGPVHRVQLPTGAAVWVVTRYEDVKAALADPRLSLDKRNSGGGWAGFELPPALDANLLNMDPPDHARIRRLVSKAFTARRIEGMRGRVQAVCATLVDEFASRDQAELVSELAIPLATLVIGDLLGVPNKRREEFRRGANALLELETQDPEQLKTAIGRLVLLITELIAQKRADHRDDLLSALIAVRDHEDRLSEDELTSLVFLLLLAGHESTVHLISLSILTLLQHPEQHTALRTNAQTIPRAVDELLRFIGPAQLSIRRFPLEDIQIGETTIPAGETVMLALGCTNRDPDRFADPETFDPGRDDAHAHLAFGHGIHHCLGAQLAQLETETVLETLIARFPNLRLAIAADQLDWKTSFRGRGLNALPVTF